MNGLQALAYLQKGYLLVNDKNLTISLIQRFAYYNLIVTITGIDKVISIKDPNDIINLILLYQDWSLWSSTL